MKIADQLVDSSFSATINAPIEKIDIPEWAFNLPEKEYQDCSPAHISAAKTIGPDGRRMSINVEIIGGSLMVQHYQEEVSEPQDLVRGLERQGIPFDVFKAQRQPNSIYHNRTETPLFAESIERAALGA